MLSNQQFQGSAHSRLRRLLPPPELSRYLSSARRDLLWQNWRNVED